MRLEPRRPRRYRPSDGREGARRPGRQTDGTDARRQAHRFHHVLRRRGTHSEPRIPADHRRYALPARRLLPGRQSIRALQRHPRPRARSVRRSLQGGQSHPENRRADRRPCGEDQPARTGLFARTRRRRAEAVRRQLHSPNHVSQGTRFRLVFTGSAGRLDGHRPPT